MFAFDSIINIEKLKIGHFQGKYTKTLQVNFNIFKRYSTGVTYVLTAV